MKGGVPCLAAMFCRQAKNTVADDAIIVQKHGRGEIPPTAVNGTRFWRGKDTAVTLVSHDVHSEWRRGEFHICVPSDGITTVLEATPPTKQGFPVLGNVDIALHPPYTDAGNFSAENGMGGAEFEEGDADEDAVAHNIPQETPDCDSDHLMSDVASDLTVNHDYAAHTEAVDTDSARYYQKSLSGTYGSNMVRENSFTDVEVTSGHFSDPGVYRATELESICSSPILPHDIEPGGHETADKHFLKQVDLGTLSESDSARHPDSPSAVSGKPIIPLSYESSSLGSGGRELSSGRCVDAGGSPRSEGATKRNTSHAMFKLGPSSLVMESQKRNPWWEVFLVSHRNIHLMGNGGVPSSLSEGNVGRMSPVNGYVSDMESKSGLVSSSALLEGASDSEKEHINWRRSGERSKVSTRASQLKIIDNVPTAKFLKPEPEGEISAFSLYQSEFSTGDFRAFNTALTGDSLIGMTGLSRVEEWVSRVHTMAPSIDDDQKQIDAQDCPESLIAPAASFFEPFGCESEDRKQVAATLTRVDVTQDNDAEMTKMVARSVNPLSTVAHFSGVGLKVIPSLGTFGSLKTLNLSANSFVRITPGCLPKSLHSLDISRNNIVVIEGLKGLTRLRVLNLSFNRISRIGNGLSSCTSLKEVYLAGNKISEVEGLHRLSKLVVLDLSFNKLITTKSMGQIAANYKSLQAFNLLGNAVHSNLGDEQMRRFVTGICPHLVYLNKQALKSVSNREPLGKDLKGSGKSITKPSKRGSGHQVVSSHRRTYSGGVGGNVKNKSAGKGGLVLASVSQEGHCRKGWHQSRSMSSKESLPKGYVPLALAANTIHRAQKGRELEQSEVDESPIATNDGVLFCEDNHWSPAIAPGVVHAC